MKILFVNFNVGSTPGINNGIAILSAVLKNKGHHVELMFLSEEMGYSFDIKRIGKDIIRFNPDIIGISLMEPQFKYMKKFCHDLKNCFSGFVICGGPHPTMDPVAVLSVEGVNAVCIGEGEDALCELADALKSKADYRQIKNLWYKMPDGTITRNKLRPFKKIDELPVEDKELFDLDKLIELKNLQLEMMIGRGCPYKCSYCINESYFKQYKNMCNETIRMKDYLRTKKVDVVIKEINDSVSKHPQIKKLSFIDDNLLVYGNLIDDFCKKYKREIGLPFLCNVNPMSFDEAKGKLLKDAGCEVIRFGIESGSERIKRDIMKRHITNESVEKTFNIARKLGIMTSSYNMIGLPTETKKEVFKTLRLNAAILPDTVKIMTFYPFKNTPIYGLCIRLALINHDKKEKLDNYDTFTCLNFSSEHQLFLKKIQIAFSWYLNAFLENEASVRYHKLITRIEAMNEDEWCGFDFDAEDRHISNKLKAQNVLHYTKFTRSLAVRFLSGQYDELLRANNDI